MKIILFTMEGCDYCKEVKELLKSKDIEFTEKDIDEYEEDFEKFSELTGFRHTPQFLVETKIGFTYVSDFDTLEEAVEEIETLIKNNK